MKPLNCNPMEIKECHSMLLGDIFARQIPLAKQLQKEV